MNLGICTSFYNGYDRFLPRWALSICRQTVKPSYVCMVASGPMEDPGNKAVAESLFKRYKIKNVFITLDKHRGMGYARNAAVRNCISEWIMYLDVDDTILPVGVEYVAQYEGKADVICTALAIEGCRERRVLKYLDVSREKQLKGLHCSSSHSVYRKSFWEKAPYIEENDYLEQPFWLGLAQAGATFIGTEEPITVYHTRKDGHNMSMTQAQKEEARSQWQRFLTKGVHPK